MINRSGGASRSIRPASSAQDAPPRSIAVRLAAEILRPTIIRVAPAGTSAHSAERITRSISAGYPAPAQNGTMARRPVPCLRVNVGPLSPEITVARPCAARALRDVLARAAHGRATVISGESGPTFTLKHGTGLLAIVPFWAGAGYPAEIERVMRSAEWADVPAGATRMIVGRKISAASRTAIERGGASWADEAGRMLLDAPPLLLIIDDPSPAAELQALRRARPTTVRWTAGAGAVAEVVLGLVADRASAEPDTPSAQLPKIATLAGLAGLSAPFVSRTLRAFDDAGWTTKSGPARGTSTVRDLSLIHISEPTRLGMISYAVF